MQQWQTRHAHRRQGSSACPPFRGDRDPLQIRLVMPRSPRARAGSVGSSESVADGATAPAVRLGAGVSERRCGSAAQDEQALWATIPAFGRSLDAARARPKLIMNINFRDLKYFEVVAELGHLGAAAERLGRTQPALTKAMQRIEEAFGSPLFVREGRGIQLTPVGRLLLARSRHIREATEEAHREVSDLAQGKTGHVRIGSGPIAAEHVLPELCSLLLAEAPDISISITAAPSMTLRERLRDGDIDLLIGLTHQNDEDFIAHPIVDDVVVVAADHEHPIFQRSRIQMRDLLDWNWVLPVDAIPSRQWLDQAFQLKGLPTPRVQISANSIPLLPRLIGRVHMLSFISRLTLQDPEVGKSLREVQLEETTLTRKLGVTFRKNGYLSPAARRLLELLRSNGRNLFFPATYARDAGRTDMAH